MLRKTGLFAVLAALVVATPSQAEEHYVVMLDTGYFPDVVYPEPGDTIRFYNQGELPMSATAVDGSWSTGVLLPEQDYILLVEEGMKAQYDNSLDIVADPATATGEAGQVVEAIGTIDYLNPAPTDLGADGKPLMLADEAYAN
ncbi:cupredoxin domain-containing protein [Thalassococcus sp. BH17M4-6]|uniref:cupredoxin domain-containing protein n=1 Tax=Thalassococcus sp. BH17M4-6 TaxID=3413148 RepID=UPI003BE8EF44